MSRAQWIKENIKDGEVYVGIILGEQDEPDYHLILLPGDNSGADWDSQVEWAKSIGGELGTLRELGLARVNARKHFKDASYWSNEKHASGSGYAWFQYFGDGSQHDVTASHKFRARAFRRLITQ